MFSQGIVSLLCLLAALQLGRAGARVRGTTLVAAWGWSLLAMAALAIAWGTQVVMGDRATASQGGLWYLAAVLALCPWVAVLGAKRPGVRVWAWFVLIPLVLVLSLPVLARLWPNGGEPRVPLPLMLGYALVLLMGAGNYAGTRFALPAGVSVVGLCLIVGPLSDTAPNWQPAPDISRLWGTMLISLAVLWAWRQSLRPTAARSAIEKLWYDYRDQFGIVWARRFLERVNERAVIEHWEWRLADEGFLPAGVMPASPEEIARELDSHPRIDHTFRWLLRRFVDPEWIERRIGPSLPPATTEVT